MIIIGIDPGVARIGWATIDTSPSVHPKAYGCITTQKSDNLPQRLLIAHKALTLLFKRFHPDCVSVEDLFFANNAKTAINVGQARGIILLTAAQQRVPVVSYSPLTVKQTISGSGSADKGQMQRMVTRILKLKEVPTPDDTADALAIALTHAYSFRLKGKTL